MVPSQEKGQNIAHFLHSLIEFVVYVLPFLQRTRVRGQKYQILKNENNGVYDILI
jgi:hypothetical protein